MSVGFPKLAAVASGLLIIGGVCSAQQLGRLDMVDDVFGYEMYQDMKRVSEIITKCMFDDTLWIWRPGASVYPVENQIFNACPLKVEAGLV